MMFAEQYQITNLTAIALKLVIIKNIKKNRCD